MNMSMKAVGVAQTIEQLEDLSEQFGGTATWVVGSEVEYSVYLEFGTSKMPPYPTFQPAIKKVMNSKADDIADDADSVDELVKALATEIEKEARKIAQSTDQRPYPQTGTFAGSIEAKKVR